jgi:hypothetical protein
MYKCFYKLLLVSILICINEMFITKKIKGLNTKH